MMEIEEDLQEEVRAHELAAAVYVKAERDLVAAEELLAAANLVHGTIMALAEDMQHGVAQRLSAIATRCLAAVFDEDPYTFSIVFEAHANRTAARCVFTRGGHVVDPLESSGYGTIDVASFGLRCAALAMCRPAARRLIVMDEPFRFVSKLHRPSLARLLHVLADELGTQIVMVTHIPELHIGEILEV